jgi:hypothetical protein
MDESVDLINYLRQALIEAAGDEGLRSQLATAYHEALHTGMMLAWIVAKRRMS